MYPTFNITDPTNLKNNIVQYRCVGEEEWYLIRLCCIKCISRFGRVFGLLSLFSIRKCKYFRLKNNLHGMLRWFCFSIDSIRSYFTLEGVRTCYHISRIYPAGINILVEIFLWWLLWPTTIRDVVYLQQHNTIRNYNLIGAKNIYT